MVPVGKGSKKSTLMREKRLTKDFENYRIMREIRASDLI